MEISHAARRTAVFLLRLLQPIYKGHSKDKTDPASYRGISLNDTLAKLFEGLLITRLTTHTELLNTLIDSQLETNPHTQTHDAIYSRFTMIQHDEFTLENPTYTTLQGIATHNNTLHHAATHCITLQHTATVLLMMHTAGQCKEAKTVDTDKSKAAGKETAEAWSNVWNGKVQAYQNM